MMVNLDALCRFANLLANAQGGVATVATTPHQNAGLDLCLVHLQGGAGGLQPTEPVPRAYEAFADKPHLVDEFRQALITPHLSQPGPRFCVDAPTLQPMNKSVLL